MYIILRHHLLFVCLTPFLLPLYVYGLLVTNCLHKNWPILSAASLPLLAAHATVDFSPTKSPPANTFSLDVCFLSFILTYFSCVSSNPRFLQHLFLFLTPMPLQHSPYQLCNYCLQFLLVIFLFLLLSAQVLFLCTLFFYFFITYYLSNIVFK